MSRKSIQGRGPAKKRPKTGRPTRKPAGNPPSPRRAQRAADERRRAQRQRVQRTVLVVGTLLVVGIAVAVLLGDGGASDDSGSGDAASIEGLRTFEVPSANHVAGEVDYPQTPPAGGDHAPVWQNCGFYGEPIRPVLGVHSLEHGAVWITFAPDLAADQVDTLRAKARQPYVLVSRWTGGLPSPVVVSAWGRQLALPSATDPRLDEFLRQFRQGSQAPEPGAPCTGGQGSPS